MHPILARGGRLALYLAAWTIVGLLLGALAAMQVPLPLLPALAIFLPTTIAYGLFCLSSWYVARSMPLGATGALRITVTALTAAAVSSGAWLLLVRGWSAVISPAVTPAMPGATFQETGALILGFGLLLYLLALTLGYVIAAMEHSREAERRGLEGRVLAREAELRSLRAQIDPHFLFNSLHSISALTGADPAAARRMCVLLADFLRETLVVGGEAQITLDRELALARHFLDIERIRFGDRLALAIDAGNAGAALVPPLLLQPLVENAVTHGIAHVLEGGTITVRAGMSGATVTIAVENPCDPDRPKATGTGMGLANVRARLRALHGDDARVTVGEGEGHCRVEIALPAAAAGREAQA